MRALYRGLIAGAVGTMALDITSYLDMALRGRPSSTTPERTVRRMATSTGVDLGDGARADNRAAGIGALLGYATGLTVTVAYTGAVREPLPLPRAAAVLTVAAMLASNAPMTILRITDPRTWSATDWVSDVVPHAAYGVVAAAVDGALRQPR
ncbi:hypothetical protein ACNTMW_28380 [Planosporangium sp. 12N6]|uniref:hypothetical protein n=1 Tax=Planosporangium spinosum TaxID=3402278 RepID=UPI003CF99DDB